MRILHIVTMVAKDGAFGGPSQVAMSQVAALRGAGEGAVLISSGRGYRPGHRSISGAPVRLFGSVNLLPRSGFAGTSSIGLLAWLVANLGRFDLVHLHLARDLVMVPSALIVWLSRKPFVVQAHGMIGPTRKPLGMVLDRLVTRRVLRTARALFTLREQEGRDLRIVAQREVNSTILPNGLSPASQRDHSGHVGRQVLFLARLHERKRPIAFTQMAIRMAPKFPDVMFYLVGPDEGEAAIVDDLIARAGLEGRIVLQPPVPPEDVRRRMSEALVYVLPARDEPFGLTVLEALSVGVPVILSASGGLASVVEAAGAGIAVDESEGSLDSAVAQLLTSEARRVEMGARGRQLVNDRFSIDQIAEELLAVYRSIHENSEPDRAGAR